MTANMRNFVKVLFLVILHGRTAMFDKLHSLLDLESSYGPRTTAVLTLLAAATVATPTKPWLWVSAPATKGVSSNQFLNSKPTEPEPALNRKKHYISYQVE